MITRLKKSIIKEVIKYLLKLDNFIYQKISKYSVILSDGVHPKHRLTKYHKFFTDNLKPTDIVLDVGCGNGYNSYQIAKKVKKVVGVDINSEYISLAKKKYNKENIEFLNQDILNFDKNMVFDVIVLSNVLEHIKDRIDFLEKISKKGKKVLIRVPMIDRNWLVLYKREMGIEYRSDTTHYIEYTYVSFVKELNMAGLKIIDFSIKFGEIWAVAGVC